MERRLLFTLLFVLLSGCQTVGNGGLASLESAKPLRVCAGEDELPYSNRRREGFENAIAEELGKALKRPVEYVWWQDARFVVRDYLNASKCDVIIGADPEDPRLATTQPYYRSGYVFVARPEVTIEDYDDAQLRQAERIAFVPHSPAEVMLRKIGRYEDMFFYIHELVDFQSRRNKYVRWDPARLIRDVASGKAQVAVMWGPSAARYVKEHRLKMHLIPDRQRDRNGKPVPHHYSVALGVRKDDEALRLALEQALAYTRREIEAILKREGIPLLPLGAHIASQEDKQ